MIKRAFWLVVGYTAGLGTSWWAFGRVRRSVRRYVPSEVAGRVGDTVGRKRRDVRRAVADGRIAMRRREAELHAELRADLG